MPMSCASPSWRTPVAPNAVVGLAVAACLAGVLCGGAYYLVSRVFDLVIVAALVAGVMVAVPVEGAARRLRVSNYVVVGLCGALAGATCDGTKLTLNGDRRVRQAVAQPGVPPLVRSKVTAALRQPRQRLSMAWRAVLSARLEVVHLGATTHRIEGPVVWLVLALELLACAYAAGSQARDSFRHHWCPDCDAGCQPEVILEVAPSCVTELCAAIDGGDWARLVEFERVDGEGTAVPRVNLEQCAEPAHDAHVSVRDAPGRYRRSWQLSPGEVVELRRAVAAWTPDADADEVEDVGRDPLAPES